MMKKGLTKIDKAISGNVNNPNISRGQRQRISNYAIQPENVSQGASLAANSLMTGFSNSISAISNGGVWQLPHAVIQPAIGTLEALSNLTLGIRNTIDKSEYSRAK